MSTRREKLLARKEMKKKVLAELMSKAERAPETGATEEELSTTARELKQRAIVGALSSGVPIERPLTPEAFARAVAVHLQPWIEHLVKMVTTYESPPKIKIDHSSGEWTVGGWSIIEVQHDFEEHLSETLSLIEFRHEDGRRASIAGVPHPHESGEVLYRVTHPLSEIRPEGTSLDEAIEWLLSLPSGA